MVGEIEGWRGGAICGGEVVEQVAWGRICGI